MSGHWFPKRTIGSLVDERLAHDGARQALVFEDRRWTFAELAREIDAVGHGLVALGIAPGDKVSLWMMNRPEWICAALAAMRIGAVLVPINTRFRTEDAAYVLGQSDSSTLIIAARSGPIDYLGMVRTLLPALGSSGEAVSDPRLPALQRVIVLGDGASPGTIAWSSLLAAGMRVPDDALRARIAERGPRQAGSNDARPIAGSWPMFLILASIRKPFTSFSVAVSHLILWIPKLSTARCPRR